MTQPGRYSVGTASAWHEPKEWIYPIPSTREIFGVNCAKNSKSVEYEWNPEQISPR